MDISGHDNFIFISLRFLQFQQRKCTSLEIHLALYLTFMFFPCVRAMCKQLKVEYSILKDTYCGFNNESTLYFMSELSNSRVCPLGIRQQEEPSVGV